MFDAVQGATMQSPDEVFLNPIRCAERQFLKDTKDPNESRRRHLMDLAAGRIAWVCRRKPADAGELLSTARSEWRGVSHQELVESLQSDVEAYRQAEADHKEEALRVAKRRASLLQRRSRKRGLFGRKRPETTREVDVTYETAYFRNVPMITFTQVQLERGLELLVERGYLRKEGEGDNPTYFVDKHFFKDLKMLPPQLEVYEP
jgi:hypothetical protein